MNDHIPKAIIFYFEKLADFATPALFAVFLLFSGLLTKITEILFKDIPLKDLYIPFIIAGISFLFFLLVFTADFFSGIAASQRENQEGNFIKSKLLWSSVWKIVGISVINLFLLIFTLIFLVMELSVLHYTFVVMIPMFMLMATAYEIHSIGENIERMYGKKPKYFNFIERLAKTIENNIINKLKNILK